MTPDALRDAIVTLAQEIAKRSTSPTVDQWAAEIVTLAGQIPALAPTIIERRHPNSDRRVKDDPMLHVGRRIGARRGPPKPAAPVLTDLVVFAPDNLIVGVTAQATVQAIMRGNSVLGIPGDEGVPDVTVTWSSTDTGVATIDSSTGVITPVAAGTTTIRATARGITGSDTCTVVTPTPTLTSLTIAPDAATVETSLTIQFTATAVWSDGLPNNPALTWSVDSGVGTINSSTGLYTAPGTAGSAVIKVVSGAISDTTTVTVTAPAAATLTSLTVVPDAPTLEINQSQQFAVTAVWSDGTTTVPSVAWSIVSGSGVIDSNGLFQAGSGAGSVTVRATSGSVSDTTTVTVNTPPPPPVTLQTLTLSPATATLQPSQTQQFVTTALWTDGSTVLPSPLTYSITSGGGSIDSTGLYTAPPATGSAVVRVESGAVSDTSAVTINAAGAPIPVFSETWAGFADTNAVASAYDGTGPFNRVLGSYNTAYQTLLGGSPAFRTAGYALENDATFGKCLSALQLGRDLYATGTSSSGSCPTFRVSWTLPTTLSVYWVERYFRFGKTSDMPPGSTSSGWTTVNDGTPSYKLIQDVYASRGAMSSDFFRMTFQNTGQLTDDFHTPAKPPTGTTVETLLSKGPAQGTGQAGLFRIFNFPTTAVNDEDGWYRTILYYNRISATEFVAGGACRKSHKLDGTPLATTTGTAGAWRWGFWRFTNVQAPGPATGIRTVGIGGNFNGTLPSTQKLFLGPVSVYDGTQYADPYGILALAGVTP